LPFLLLLLVLLLLLFAPLLLPLLVVLTPCQKRGGEGARLSVAAVVWLAAPVSRLARRALVGCCCPPCPTVPVCLGPPFGLL
jgi:hypothetical protein